MVPPNYPMFDRVFQLFSPSILGEIPPLFLVQHPLMVFGNTATTKGLCSLWWLRWEMKLLKTSRNWKRCRGTWFETCLWDVVSWGCVTKVVVVSGYPSIWRFKSWKVMGLGDWMLTNWRLDVLSIFQQDSCAEPSLHFQENHWHPNKLIQHGGFGVFRKEVKDYILPTHPTTWAVPFWDPQIGPSLRSFWQPNLGGTNRRVDWKMRLWKVLLQNIYGTQSSIMFFHFLTICFFQFFEYFCDFRVSLYSKIRFLYKIRLCFYPNLDGIL